MERDAGTATPAAAVRTHGMQPTPAPDAAPAPRRTLLRSVPDALALAYLMTGTYRHDSRLDFPGPFSLNQILGVALGLTLVPALWSARRSPLRARATLAAVLALTAMLLVRLPGSANPEYGSFKLLGYVLLVLPVLL